MPIDNTFLLKNNTESKKILRFDNRARKEFLRFTPSARAKTKGILLTLARDGKLIEPYGKKISDSIFEIRIKSNGEWRLLYTYNLNNYIVILCCFQKKTQKTPHKHLQTALKRLKECRP